MTHIDRNPSGGESRVYRERHMSVDAPRCVDPPESGGVTVTYPRETSDEWPEEGEGRSPDLLLVTSFPTTDDQVAKARAATEDALLSHPAYDAGLCAQLVSELATNAILHSGSDHFGLVVSLTPAGLVRIAVSHSGQGKTKPEVKQPELIEEGGRGLRLVAVLSDGWGVTKRRSDGFTVWFELAPEGQQATAVAGVGSRDGR